MLERQAMTTKRYHGGDLDGATARFGEPTEGWLDLSTGISPFPYPVPRIEPECFRRLPTAAAVRRLERIAARTYGVENPACVVAAPGSQALIQWLPRLRESALVAVLAPTYGEHEAAWAAGQHRVRHVRSLAAAAGADVVVVGQPNNPDGRELPAGVLVSLRRDLARRGGWLVVDEAFADVALASSLSDQVGAPGLIVLRSFGKFFGLAGLRLGFALAPRPVTAALREALGPWAVSGPALAVGTSALADQRWIDATRERLARARAKLDRLLTENGLSMIGGTDLFRLVEHRRARRLFDRLGRRGIFVRRFPDHPLWLRFGVPAPAGHRRLAAALAVWRDR
ncbi:MAG: threonine-phosphate decarboxylase [Alphaproteobacteria bacterium]|nr:threonine-phosphate decarboxylase [Alphaproteobacteria bacterium]